MKRQLADDQKLPPCKRHRSDSRSPPPPPPSRREHAVSHDNLMSSRNVSCKETALSPPPPSHHETTTSASSPDTSHNETDDTKPDQSISLRSSFAVLQYFYEMIQDLDQGHLDQCLSKQLSCDALSTEETALASAMDTALKKVAQRQLRLETDNLRYRIAMQQQHQILASQYEEEEKVKPVSRSNSDNDEKKDGSGGENGDTKQSNDDKREDSSDSDDDSKKRQVSSEERNVSSSSSSSSVHENEETPEDGLVTIKESSILEKISSSDCSPVLPTSNLTSPSGYFGKKAEKMSEREE